MIKSNLRTYTSHNLIKTFEKKVDKKDSNSDFTAKLAKSITRSASKQSYYTAKFMVDMELVNDFYRAYAYFRWVDDIIDETPLSLEERTLFILSQRKLIDSLYKNEKTLELSRGEQIISDLIKHDKEKNSKLQSFIRNMFAIVEFDAHRKDELISVEQLEWYSNCLAKSVTDGLQYFIGNGHSYPSAKNQYQAAKAAHIMHLLRDMVTDIENGFINIPREYLVANDLNPTQIDHPAMRLWVKGRVNLARQYFREGNEYLNGLKVLRCKIVGQWYCARFEKVLKKIERDDYLLCNSYNERRRGSGVFKMMRLAFVVPLRHWSRF